MSIQGHIDRINTSLANTYAVLAAYGAVMPSVQDADHLAETAASIGAVIVTADQHFFTSHTAQEIVDLKNEGKLVILNAGIVFVDMMAENADDGTVAYVEFSKLMFYSGRPAIMQVRITGNTGAANLTELNAAAIGAAKSSHSHAWSTITSKPTSFTPAAHSHTEAFTVTLSASGWSSKAQTVSDSRFAASGYAYVIRPDAGSFNAYVEAMVYADNITTAGQMKFHCDSVPTASLTVNILRTEVAK